MTGEQHVVEARSFDHVPESERTGTVARQFQFWFMVNATLITAFTGAVGPLFHLGLPATLIAVVSGSVFGTLFQAFHGAQGPRMGLPQMIQSRVQFGSRGAVIPIGVATVVYFGFSIFYLQTGATSVVTLAGGDTHVLEIVLGVVATLLAIVGYSLILRTQSLLAWVTVANLVALTVAAVTQLPVGRLMHDGSWTLTGFLAQFGAAAGYQIAIAPLVSDYTRYLPSRTRSAAVSGAVFFGTLLSAVWIEFLGAAVALSYPDLDVISGIGRLGDRFGSWLGTTTLVVSALTCVVTGAVALYSGAVSFLSTLEAFRPLRSTALLRTVTLTVAGAAVIVAGLALPDDILATFSVFLVLLGYLLIPWTAINLTDYYLVRRGRYSITDIVRSDGGMYGPWNVRGMTSYIVGLATMVPFFSTSLYTGPAAAALHGADIAFAIGLAVSSTCYVLLMRSHNLDAEFLLVQRAPVNTLDPEPDKNTEAVDA
ncbi:cytosine permease [Streptomyces sp. NPDC026672]|uniref:purine-cytosine permease family protein n=1 Tax=unclassified Streptomyces TaxID=2593676 RepID=UPI0033E4184B